MNNDLRDEYRDAIREEGLGKVLKDEAIGFVEEPRALFHLLTKELRLGFLWVIMLLALLIVVMEVL